jgi:hypothetical protein
MPFDCCGRPVDVGTRVRLLNLAPFLKRGLPPDEYQELDTMVGQVFDVYQVDEYGAARVEMLWYDKEGESHSHSLALAPNEMEVISE